MNTKEMTNRIQTAKYNLIMNDSYSKSEIVREKLSPEEISNYVRNFDNEHWKSLGKKKTFFGSTTSTFRAIPHPNSDAARNGFDPHIVEIKVKPYKETTWNKFIQNPVKYILGS